MADVRKLANQALLAGSLLALPACRSAVAAKLPSTVNPIQTNANLYDKARISKPQDFTNFEPILENITNERPVPWTSVLFVSEEEFVKTCGSLADACLFPGRSGDEIFLKRTVFFPSSINVCDASRKNCTKWHNLDMLHTWSHEQGHHYDRYLGYKNWGNTRRDAWLNEVEAVAFEYYFAENLAMHYDAYLGLSLLSRDMGAAQPPKYAETIRGQEWEHERQECSRGYALYSIYSLLGVGFSSFGDLWYFIHSTSHDELQQTIVRYLPLYQLGRERSKAIYCDLTQKLEAGLLNMLLPSCENHEPASETDF